MQHVTSGQDPRLNLIAEQMKGGQYIKNPQIDVSVLKTGHNQFVSGTNRTSNHWEGRGADLYAVDGADVTPSCGPCRTFAEEVVTLRAGRPDEMGLPWGDMVGAGGWNVFIDGDHQDHLHVGFR